MLDRLPAPVRHAVIAFTAAFASIVLGGVISAAGVTGVDWPMLLVSAVNGAAVTTATVMLTLYITPLTRQYGRDKGIE